MIKDFLRNNRFAPRFGLDGEPIGMSRIDISPGKPWHGPGVVKFEMPLGEVSMKLLADQRVQPFIVGLFREDPKDPQVILVMLDVCLHDAQVSLSELDCNQHEIFKISAELRYTQLHIIFGPTALDLLSIALSERESTIDIPVVGKELGLHRLDEVLPPQDHEVVDGVDT